MLLEHFCLNTKVFLNKFSKLLWDVDQHYSKFQSRGKSFLKIVEDKFLSFNQAEDYKQKAKKYVNIINSSQVNEMKDYLDRKFMNMNCMKNSVILYKQWLKI